VPDALSSSYGGAIARPSGLKRPCPPLRDGAGAAARGRNWPPHPPMAAVTVPVVADEYNHCADGEHPEEAVEELEIENDDYTIEDTAALFGIDLGDGQHPIDVDADNGDGGVEVDGSGNTNATSSSNGKLTAACWEDFVPILDENDVRTHAICKRCGKWFAARASIGTGSLNRHMAACRKKQDNDRSV